MTIAAVWPRVLCVLRREAAPKRRGQIVSPLSQASATWAGEALRFRLWCVRQDQRCDRSEAISSIREHLARDGRRGHGHAHRASLASPVARATARDGRGRGNAQGGGRSGTHDGASALRGCLHFWLRCNERYPPKIRIPGNGSTARRAVLSAKPWYLLCGRPRMQTKP